MNAIRIDLPNIKWIAIKHRTSVVQILKGIIFGYGVGRFGSNADITIATDELSGQLFVLFEGVSGEDIVFEKLSKTVEDDLVHLITTHMDQL
jgi:hypothetical protein